MGHTSGNDLANPQNCQKYDHGGGVSAAQRTGVSGHATLKDTLLTGVVRHHCRLLCGENVCHEHTKVDDIMGEEQPKVDGDEFGMLLPTSSKTSDTGEHGPCTCAGCCGATYPKKEMMASAIQHAIPTYGIAAIPLSSPEGKIDAAQSGSAGWEGVTRERTAYRWKY